MPLPKPEAMKLVGRRVTIRYEQTYTNGRSETLTTTGRIVRVTDHSVEINQGTMSLPGFGRVPVSQTIALNTIIEVKR